MTLFPRSAGAPRATPRISPLISSTAAFGTIRSSADLPVVLRRDLAASPLEMNAIKGSFGERLAERLLRLSSDTHTRWITPHRGSAGQGIDLLRVEHIGRRESVVVSEVKFGSSQLGQTRDGRQLGPDWVASRLRATSDSLRRRGAVTLGAAKKAMLRDAAMLQRAVNDRGLVQTELLRVEIVGSRFVVSAQRGDEVVELLRDSFDSLPKWAKSAVRTSFENTFRAHGFSNEEARRVSKEACENPRFFRHMAKERTYTWRAGLDAQTALTGATAMLVAGAVRVVMDLYTQGRVDWRGVIFTSVVAGAAAAVGNFVGVQTVSLMTGTDLGRLLTSRGLSNAMLRGSGVTGLGGVAGGVAASLVFAYGSALLGLIDWKTAHRMSATTVAGAAAGVGATSATFGIAVLVGTAGTGTPLAALSGAALAKATLAYLGGGTLAAGGWGIAGGVLVLSGVGTIAALGASATMNVVFGWLDERERTAMVRGQIAIAHASA